MLTLAPNIVAIASEIGHQLQDMHTTYTCTYNYLHILFIYSNVLADKRTVVYPVAYSGCLDKFLLHLFENLVNFVYFWQY